MLSNGQRPVSMQAGTLELRIVDVFWWFLASQEALIQWVFWFYFRHAVLDRLYTRLSLLLPHSFSTWSYSLRSRRRHKRRSMLSSGLNASQACKTKSECHILTRSSRNATDSIRLSRSFLTVAKSMTSTEDSRSLKGHGLWRIRGTHWLLFTINDLDADQNCSSSAIMHDPKEFPQPERFWPERYLVNKSSIDPRDYSFGFGRRYSPWTQWKLPISLMLCLSRRCPGISLANASIFIVITNILALFRITAPRDTAGRPCPPKLAFTSGHVS